MYLDYFLFILLYILSTAVLFKLIIFTVVKFFYENNFCINPGQSTLIMIVEVVALCCQHHTSHGSVDNRVSQLPQT